MEERTNEQPENKIFADIVGWRRQNYATYWMCSVQSIINCLCHWQNGWLENMHVLCYQD